MESHFVVQSYPEPYALKRTGFFRSIIRRNCSSVRTEGAVISRDRSLPRSINTRSFASVLNLLVHEGLPKVFIVLINPRNLHKFNY